MFRFMKNRRYAACALACTILLGSMTGIAANAKAASFDCDGASLQPDEKAICNTRTLNDADVKMVTTFELLRGLVAMGARGTLQDEQSAWLKSRQACGADAACLKLAYEERMKQLDQAYNTLSRPL